MLYYLKSYRLKVIYRPWTVTVHVQHVECMYANCLIKIYKFLREFVHLCTYKQTPTGDAFFSDFTERNAPQIDLLPSVPQRHRPNGKSLLIEVGGSIGLVSALWWDNEAFRGPLRFIGNYIVVSYTPMNVHIIRRLLNCFRTRLALDRKRPDPASLPHLTQICCRSP